MADIATAIPQRRRLVTSIPGPNSIALAGRRQGAVAPGVSSTLPVYIDRGEGAVLIDVDGNALIDLGSGIAVTSVGHAVPAVVEAVREQIGRFAHTCFMVGPYEGYVAVCEQLNARTPGQHAKLSALFNSGAEAVENAVKIARHATGRQAIVVFDHAYHGRTNLTMALTAKNMPYKDRFGPFAPEIYRAPVSYPFRDPAGFTGRDAAGRAVDLIDKQVGAADVRGRRSSSRSRAKEASWCRRRASWQGWRSGARHAGSCWWPTKCSPDSAGRAPGSPANTKMSCPT